MRILRSHFRNSLTNRVSLTPLWLFQESLLKKLTSRFLSKIPSMLTVYSLNKIQRLQAFQSMPTSKHRWSSWTALKKDPTTSSLTASTRCGCPQTTSSTCKVSSRSSSLSTLLVKWKLTDLYIGYVWVICDVFTIWNKT